MILLIRTCQDDNARRTYTWAEHLKKVLKQRGHHFIECSGDMAIRKNVEVILTRQSVKAIIFYGHGDAGKLGLRGQNNKAILSVDNLYLLKDKFIYAMACYSGGKFGALAVKSGAKCYIGYEGEFQFTSMDEELFRECTNAGILAMIECGCTSGQAVDAMDRRFGQKIAIMQKQALRGDFVAFWIYTRLLKAQQMLKMYGDPSFRL